MRARAYRRVARDLAVSRRIADFYPWSYLGVTGTSPLSIPSRYAMCPDRRTGRFRHTPTHIHGFVSAHIS